jgi:hypothetical protein
MRKARVQHELRFGPFRTAHFRQQVDARFRRAFYSYLDQQVIPSLEGDIVRIGGRVYSHYDRRRFNDLVEVKHRYFYELRFQSAAGVEEASGEVDYDPATGVWTPSRLKPPRFVPLSYKRTEQRERDLERQISMEARNYHPVRPAKCPGCGCQRIAKIMYGYALMSPQLKGDLRARRVCLGGCIVSSDDSDPQWCCLACGHRWGLSARGLARREILKGASGEPR